MKKLFVILFAIVSTNTFAQISVTKAQGSSIITVLGYGIKLNDGSSLNREKITLNDASCPIQLNDVEILTSYSERSYNFKQNGSISINEPIVAYEIHYMLYDVFGEHLKTLSATKIIDLEGMQELPKTSSWYASETNTSQYYRCVAYVANVRTKAGKLWKYNYPSIKEKLNELEIAFEETYLPKNDPEK